MNRKRWKKTCCAVLLGSVLWGTSAKAYNAGEILGLVGGTDADEELASLGTAVVLVQQDGGGAAYTSASIYAEGNDYSLITTQDVYTVQVSASAEGWDLLEWSIDGMTDDPAALYVASPVQGQTADLVYMDGELSTQTAEVVIQDVSSSNGLFNLSVSGLPGSAAVYPAVILDDGGNCLGIVTAQDAVWAPYVDENAFYGGTAGGGSGGAPGGNSGGEPGGGSSEPASPSQPSDSGGGLLEDAMSGAVIGVVAVLAVMLIRKFGKKKQSASGQGTAVSFPEPQPTPLPPEDFQPTEPLPDVPQGPEVSGGFRLVAVGGYMDGRIYPIGDYEITFGRDPSSTIRFPADAKGVSRAHCKLFWKDGTLMLMDCGSSYGTFIQGGKLQPMQPVPIKYGDIFFIGEKRNCFKIQ